MTDSSLKLALAVAEEIAKSDEEAHRDTPTTDAQRITIAILQSRAMECRQWAGQLQIVGFTKKYPSMHYLWQKLLDRSDELEQLGMKLATEWPPSEIIPAVPERQLVI